MFRKIIIFLIVNVISSSVVLSSPLAKQDEAIKPSVVEAASSSGGQQAATEEAPATTTSSSSRRIVSYDQRQEGKYNIRADLENFVILVIPSSPSSGASLLDLLTRSNAKKQANKRAHPKKHHASPADDKVKDDHSLDYLKQSPTVATVQEQSMGRVANNQFIEGRTPYHVDISSTLEHFQPKKNIEVIRSNKYARNIHVPIVRLLNGADGDVLDALPIASIVPVKGKKRSTNSLTSPITTTTSTASNHKYSNLVLVNNARDSKSIDRSTNNLSPSNEFNTNSVVILTPIDEDYNDRETNRGFNDLTDTINSFDSLNVGNIDRLVSNADDDNTGDEDLLNINNNNNNRHTDGWELTLLGSHEQCGPDRRRDSYGICQFVPPDFQ